LIEMYLAGVSVRRVEDITEALWGTRVSPSTVSDSNKKIYATIEAWRNRPIEGEHPYVYLDGIVLTLLPAVARAAGIQPSQLYGWRRQLVRRSQPAASFAAVRIAAEPAPAGGLIEVEFANGFRLRITGAVDPATLTTTIETLAGRGRGR
jgi:Transposase, Mutator family/Transposase